MQPRKLASLAALGLATLVCSTARAQIVSNTLEQSRAFQVSVLDRGQTPVISVNVAPAAYSDYRLVFSQCDPRTGRGTTAGGFIPGLFNGQRYDYYTDLSGSVLGHGVGFFRPEHCGPSPRSSGRSRRSVFCRASAARDELLLELDEPPQPRGAAPAAAQARFAFLSADVFYTPKYQASACPSSDTSLGCVAQPPWRGSEREADRRPRR